MWSGWPLRSAWSIAAMLSLAALPFLGWLSMRHALRGSRGARRYFDLMGVALVLLVVSATQVHRSRPLMTVRFLPPVASEPVLTGAKSGAILAVLPDRTTMLIAASTDPGMISLAGVLQDLDIGQVDYLVLTGGGPYAVPFSAVSAETVGARQVIVAGQTSAETTSARDGFTIASGRGFTVRLLGGEATTVGLEFGRKTNTVTRDSVITDTATYSLASLSRLTISTDGESVWAEQGQ